MRSRGLRLSEFRSKFAQSSLKEKEQPSFIEWGLFFMAD